MATEGMKYGRTDAEWDTLVIEGRRFVEDRARLPRLTNYTELNDTLARRTDVRPFDFGRKDERAAMGELLEQTLANGGFYLPTTAQPAESLSW